MSLRDELVQLHATLNELYRVVDDKNAEIKHLREVVLVEMLAERDAAREMNTESKRQRDVALTALTDIKHYLGQQGQDADHVYIVQKIIDPAKRSM